MDGGMAGMRFFLGCQSIPTAVMCSNDMTAIGVMHAAAEARLRIPEDISIIGFDDINIARFMIPPLTTIRMSCQEIAHSAFKVLRGYLEKGATFRPEELNLRTKLQVRNSTGVPRKGNKPADRA
jgi:LacI family transcriptional regulator